MSLDSGLGPHDSEGQLARDHQSLVAQAFDAAPNGFVIIDAAGKIVAANSELERMFGCLLYTSDAADE